MELRQKIEIKKLMAPSLRQSLQILSLPLLDLKNMVEQELENNPFLEEKEEKIKPPRLPKTRKATPDLNFLVAQISKSPSLQDLLLRQLGMFAESDEQIRIGQEIIGNLDDNGYLKIPLEEIAASLNISLADTERTLDLIQQFEPSGVAARSVPECLCLQLKLTDETNPLLFKIIQEHLKDVAKKDYLSIAKALGEPTELIENLVKRILRLDPKPGRNYSPECTQSIVPDIIINEGETGLEIIINNEDIPMLNINKDYKQVLKDNNLDPQSKEFLRNKLQTAQELLRAISKRQDTLRRVIEAIVEYQEEALMTDLSNLKPLTLSEIADKLNIHETTVCRVIMNKYAMTPFGVVSLKSFFPSRINGQNGSSKSDSYVKVLIKELIDQEDKKRPLSDLDIASLINKDNELNIARRTVTKYREEMKILSSTYRRSR